MLELPPTPGSSGINATFNALAAAAASLENDARVNQGQVAENNDSVAALNEQSADLTRVADSALQVAAGIRGLLPPTQPQVPDGPQAALFGGGKFRNAFATEIAGLKGVLQTLIAKVNELATKIQT